MSSLIGPGSRHGTHGTTVPRAKLVGIDASDDNGLQLVAILTAYAYLLANLPRAAPRKIIPTNAAEILRPRLKLRA